MKILHLNSIGTYLYVFYLKENWNENVTYLLFKFLILIKQKSKINDKSHLCQTQTSLYSNGLRENYLQFKTIW